MEDGKLPVCTQSEYEDIGHGVSIQKRYLDGVLAGVAYDHPRPDTGIICPGYIPVKNDDWPKEGWDLLSETPLTVSPSLLCRVCNNHGFIQGGRWIPA